MGVNFKDIVVRHDLSLKDLEGKRLGIDAFNWLYQFLSIIRQRDGTPLMDSKGRVTSHLTGLFYRTTNLLEAGVLPCYVFDGKPPSFKKVTEARRERRAKAKEEYLAAKERGDLKTAYSKATQSARLTSELISEAKTLIKALGLPIIQAPSEGEAQAAYMVQQGDFYAVATQDYDALMFGSPLVVRNLSSSQRRGSPELIKLKEVLESIELSREELIMMGVLIGTDFNPGGVKGVGPKTALKLVKEHGVDAWQKVEWDWTIHPPDLVDFFLNPPVKKDYDLKWVKPDLKEIHRLLVTEHEFSEDRVVKVIDRLVKASAQSGLSDFF